MYVHAWTRGWTAAAHSGPGEPRALRGVRPDDLPIESVTRHRLTVNQQVTRETGVTIPPEVRACEDQAIG
jgi:hypothetical protein